MKEFMAVCVKAVDKFPQSDFVSPVFIFERLCNIIIPVSRFVTCDSYVFHPLYITKFCCICVTPCVCCRKQTKYQSFCSV